jgi:hypothetical protein
MLSGPQPVRQLKQGKRVAACFREDALKNLLVEGAEKGRAQEGACFRRAETIEGKVRQTVELIGDGSGAEQERDVFRPQSTSRNGECPRRLSIDPLSIVNDT